MAYGSPAERIYDDYGSGSGWTTVSGGTRNNPNPGGSNKTCKLVVYYYANGGTGTPPETTVKTYYGPYQEVQLQDTVKGPGDLENGGNAFLGWATSENSQTVVYNPGDIITRRWAANGYGNDMHYLYAVWTDKDLFVYKPGLDADQEDVPSSYRYAEKPLNQAAQLAGALFTRTGYIQVGWQTESGAEQYDLNESYTATSSESLILYPVWAPLVCTLTFKANGGTGDDIVRTVDYGTEIEFPASDVFTKNGYHIFTWNEQADGLGSAWLPGKTYTFTRNGDLTLYAFWAGDEYRVYYAESDDDGIIIPGIDIPHVEDEVSPVYPDITGDVGRISQDEDGVVSFSSAGNLVAEVPLTVTQNGEYTPDSGYAYNSVKVNVPALVDPTDTTVEPVIEPVPNFSIATYGSPFYTDRRPISKYGYTFAGWKTTEGVVLVKKDVWMDAYSIADDPTWTIQHDVTLEPIWSPNYPYGKIFYGGKETPEFGIVVEEPPTYAWPERAYIHNKVNGRNGDVLTDPKKYENVTKTYKIAVNHPDGFYSAASKVSEFLHRYYGPEYVRLEDSYEPDVYMMGIYEESHNLENILGQAGRGEISFNCKPQKYLISGSRKIIISVSGTIVKNPTNHPSEPILNIIGTGSVWINGVELKVLKNFNSVTLDCETSNAADDAGYDMNNYISLYDPIRLYPGENEIEFDETIEVISIIPRWWKI